MINLQKAVLQKFPFFSKYPKFIKSPFFSVLKKIIHEKDINDFLRENKEHKNFDFIDAVLDYFDFGYMVSNKSKQNIPSSGKVVIIANHPLGSLDALSLVKLVKEVRSDIKVVANDMLMQIDNLQDILLPVDNLKNKSTKDSIKKIYDSLNNEEAIIIFPAGEVSRARPTGIKDTKWRGGFLKFALKAKAPILPVFIDAKNSTLFYTVSSINKNISTMLLPNEMFNKRNKSISFKVGELIPYESVNIKHISDKEKVELLKKHLYKISKNKVGVFKTQTSIIHPIDKKELKKALKETQDLGVTHDKKKILLYSYSGDETILKEIGRLREYTFRKVGEGTGAKVDIDKYDYYYKHIILWDEESLEIVGAYRIGVGKQIMESKGFMGFYSHTLFEYSDEFISKLEDSIELGRSFVQPKYWGSRALDYLWFGIGAYLKQNPQIKYMYGTVSISDTYTITAKSMLVYYYNKHFGNKDSLVNANTKFVIPKEEREIFDGVFVSSDRVEEFKTLKQNLSYIDATVPTLYKQYSDLCEDGGVEFLDFGVDKDFNNCLDGFIMVSIDKIKKSKIKRYMS
jgi:putative hemolysin